MGGSLFISYRREDSEGYAGRVYDRLSQQFGDDRVFMDVDDISAGEDFIRAIDSALQSCRVLIALIGPQWASATDETGNRRLDNPNDFVRAEISAALQRSILVIPVIVHNAEMPKREDLPEALHPLLRRNALEIRHNRFNKDIDDLIETIQQYCQTKDRD